MTFLEPLAGITAAALAMPVLVLLYLLKLRRRPVRISSTLLWISAVRDLEVNAPFRWIRPSWMFFLQALGLAALCTALARPVISDSADDTIQIAILIDHSASMNAIGGPEERSRLDLAKARAAELVDQFTQDPATRCSIIAFASQPTLLSTPSGRRSVLDAAINAIVPTDQPADLDRALELAASVLTQSGEVDESAPSSPPILILLSDGTFPPPSRPRQIAGQFRFEPIPAESADRPQRANRGIVTLSARRDEADPLRTLLLVGLLSTSSRGEQIPVSIAVDGVIQTTRLVDMPPASDAGPARISITLSVPLASAALLTAAIPPGDALAADDSASLVMPAPARLDVLLVQPPAVATNADAPSRSLVPDWLLGDAIAELDISTLRREGPERAEQLLASEPDAYDLVIYDRVTPRVLPGVPSLHFGVPPASPGISVEPVALTPARPMLAWERGHPALRDVGLDAVLFSPSARVTLDQGATPRVIATGPGGPAIIDVPADGPRGRSVRRLYVVFAPADSNWPVFPSFPIFLSSSVEYLTTRAEREIGISFKTSEEARLDVGTSPRQERTLRTPDARTILVRAAPDSGRIPLGTLPRAGVYVIENAPQDDPPAARLVAINLLDPQESSIATAAGVDVGDGTQVRGSSGPVRRELWMYFALAAVILLTSEWFLYAWRARL